MDRELAKTYMAEKVAALNAAIVAAIDARGVQWSEDDPPKDVARKVGLLVDFCLDRPIVFRRGARGVFEWLTSYAMKRAREALEARELLYFVPAAMEYTWRLNGARFEVMMTVCSRAASRPDTKRLDAETVEEALQRHRDERAASMRDATN